MSCWNFSMLTWTTCRRDAECGRRSKKSSSESIIYCSRYSGFSCMLFRWRSILDIRCTVICVWFLKYGSFIFYWISLTFIAILCQTPSDGLKMEEVISKIELCNMILLYSSYWNGIIFKLLDHANLEIWNEVWWINRHFFLRFPITFHGHGFLAASPSVSLMNGATFVIFSCKYCPGLSSVVFICNSSILAEALFCLQKRKR